MFFVLVFIFFLLAFIFWMVSHIISILYGIPFVVSTDERTRLIIKLLNPKPGEKIVDLGSGDGKLLLEIVKHGSQAYGYEINPIAYLQSKIRTRRSNQGNIKIYFSNFMKANLSKYDAVVIYGFPSFMPKLERKIVSEIASELKPGARIVSNYYKFPNLKPVKEEKDVLLYKF